MDIYIQIRLLFIKHKTQTWFFTIIGIHDVTVDCILSGYVADKNIGQRNKHDLRIVQK